MEATEFIDLLDELSEQVCICDIPNTIYLIEKYKKCRTIEMGGRIVECPNCKERMVLYNPCNKRGCPNCGTKNQLAWRENVNSRLLPMGHYHLVIVSPWQHEMLWYYYKKDYINSLFSSINDSFKEYQKKKGLRYGMTMVFQSHGEGLSYHPHVHCVITPGGLDESENWVDDYCMNYSEIINGVVERFGSRFEKKMRNNAKKRYRAIDDYAKDDWRWHVTYHKNSAEGIVNYLSNTACGTVVNPEKEIEVDRERQEIIYQPAGKKRTRLSYQVFMERFFHHIPLKGTVLVRNYGLYSNRHKNELAVLKEKMGCPAVEPEEYIEECPRCKTEMRLLYQFSYEEIPEVLREYMRVNRAPPMLSPVVNTYFQKV